MNAIEGIDLLVFLAKRADREALMMSRMDCHARNVDSIVLRRDKMGRLLRAFLAWPGHRLDTNRIDGHLEVGIHDHQYDIWFKSIHGDVANVVCRRSDAGTPLLEWTFRSGVVNGSPEIKKVGEARLVEVACIPLQPCWAWFRMDEYHTIQATGVAAWLVQEGRREKEKTSLFTKREVNAEGFYAKFASRDEVIARVEVWAREARQ